MNTFKANGHEFVFGDAEHLLFRSATGEAKFPYNDSLKLRAPAISGELYLRSGTSSVSLSSLTREQLGSFLPKFFNAWAARSPDAARKAAFDYVDAQHGFTGIALFGSLVFALPVAIALLADSHQNFSCSKQLQAHAVPAQIQVVKATKKDSRSFKIKMEFTAPTGEHIQAEDLVRTGAEDDIPKTLPILYSPERPICWSLTKGLNSSEIDWPKRRYFAWFTMLFGLFFLASAMYGLAWSVLNKTRERPFRDEIREQFGLH